MVDKEALKQVATTLCALSKWEYWHGDKDRSDLLNQVAAHCMLWVNVASKRELMQATSYAKSAAKLVEELGRGSLWPE